MQKDISDLPAKKCIYNCATEIFDIELYIAFFGLVTG